VKDPIFFLLLGLGPGALYAMLGSSMVVAHKGSGVINFAHPAIAQFVVFDYIAMRTKGYIKLPWVDFLPTKSLNVPVTIKLAEAQVPFVPAFLLSLVLAAFLGVMVHFLVFRPLRSAPPLGKVIGSIGVLTYLGGVMQLNFAKLNNPNPKPVVPAEIIKNFLGLGKDYSRSGLWLLLIALIVGAVLWATYRYTRFGIATRAAAGNEKGAVLLGFSPEFLAAANWIIACVVAGFAAIIVGPFGGSLSPVQLTTQLGFFLAAMLIGRLNSIVGATIGGFGLGMIRSFSSSWLIAQHWFPQWFRNGVQEALPLIAIAVVLFVTGKKLPVRGTVEEKRLPLAPYPRRMWQHTVIWSGVVILLAFHSRNAFNKTLPLALSTMLITAILMLSYVVVTGYVGQISLAQLTLAGTAAFFMARMMANGKITSVNPFAVSGPNLAWVPAMILGIAVAIAVGLILAVPALRIRGVQLAVVTIAAAVTIEKMYFENEKLTGLRAGAPASVSKPTLFGLNLGAGGKGGLTNNPSFIIFCLFWLVLCAWLVANLRRSGTGRRFLSVRANERAAAAAGVNVPRTKLLAFGISAGLAGVAGTLVGFQQQNVSSANFVFGLGFAVIAFAYLAGITSINGAIVGAMLAPVSLIAAFGSYRVPGARIGDYLPVLGGVGLVLTAIRNPGGIAPFAQPGMRYAGDWLRKARGAEWLSFARRYLIWIAAGIAAGYVIWPVHRKSYAKFWDPILGLFIVMAVVRPLVMQIYAKVTGKAAPAAPEAAPASIATQGGAQ
jgi:branched-chain amino acid transport system permease protein